MDFEASAHVTLVNFYHLTFGLLSILKQFSLDTNDPIFLYLKFFLCSAQLVLVSDHLPIKKQAI